MRLFEIVFNVCDHTIYKMYHLQVFQNVWHLMIPVISSRIIWNSVFWFTGDWQEKISYHMFKYDWQFLYNFKLTQWKWWIMWLFGWNFENCQSFWSHEIGCERVTNTIYRLLLFKIFRNQMSLMRSSKLGCNCMESVSQKKIILIR